MPFEKSVEPIVSAQRHDFGLPGVMVEFDPAVADRLGAFESDPAEVEAAWQSCLAETANENQTQEPHHEG